MYNVIQHIAGASSVQHFAQHRLHRYTGYSGCTMPWGALDLGRSFYDDTGIYWALQLEKTEECGPWPNWQTGKISIYLSINQSIYQSIYQSINQSIYLFIYLSISLNASIYIY
jgi:hypothetical protein